MRLRWDLRGVGFSWLEQREDATRLYDTGIHLYSLTQLEKGHKVAWRQKEHRGDDQGAHGLE